MYHNLAALAEKWVYDPLGRVTSESMTISDQLQVTSKYSHIPNDNLLGWERAVDYPSGSVITEYIHLDGKLAGVDVEGTHYGDDRYSSASYRWLGDLYAGSTHGWADPRFNAPLRGIARFDEFGRRTQWTYDPYHRDEQGNAVEGGPCGFPFDPQRCNDPLLDIEGVRDVMGRLRSVKSRFAYPRWSLPTFDPLPTNQPWEWRGYEYDRRSYFTGEWTATSATEPVISSLVPNAATNLDVQMTGGALAATPWVREHETEVGGLVSIYDGSDPNPDPIWFADPRADGHRLTRVDIDRASFAITHDESGRLTHGLDYDFVYDPRGRLAAAKDAKGLLTCEKLREQPTPLPAPIPAVERATSSSRAIRATGTEPSRATRGQSPRAPIAVRLGKFALSPRAHHFSVKIPTGTPSKLATQSQETGGCRTGNEVPIIVNGPGHRQQLNSNRHAGGETSWYALVVCSAIASLHHSSQFF